MNIAIIGAGNVGQALAGSSARAGHTVTISSRKYEDAQRVANATGAQAARSNREAVQSAQVVILAVPYAAMAGIVDELGTALDGKVVVDVSNRANFENPGQVLDGTSAAEQIQGRLPRARVVKAFNTLFASKQADPTADGIQLDGYVAGDDAEAKKAVLDLVRSIGLRPIDAGPLAMARVLEGMGLLNMLLNARNNWPWQSSWKLVGPTGAAE